MEEATEIPVSEGPCSSGSSPTASGSTTDTAGDDFFIKHKVRKRDTLAGLAVKYKVTIADIKRANGFHNDSAMFGKDTLLIPTKPLPLGPEYAAWAGMIVAHYGRGGFGEGPLHLRAASAAALSELRGYYSSSPTPPGPSDDEDDGVFAPRRGRAPPGEVELMSRPAGGGSSSYQDDRLRRRGRGEEGGSEGSLEGVDFGRLSPQRAPLFRSATERIAGRDGGGGSGGGRGGAALNELKEWHRKSLQWRSQLLNKLKRAASQPALASGAAGVAQAAEAAALALAGGLGPKQGRKAD